MGECGCGFTNPTQAFQITRPAWVGVQVYPGCRECYQGPMVDIMFFDKQGREDWLPHLSPERIDPDRYGGDQHPGGIQVPLFEVEDLVAAAKDAEEESDLSEYACIADWLMDNGLALIQDALDRCERRMAERREARGR